MDFSFSFMQGIMGNTIQQPPQLIDSANNRQDDANSSDQADEGGHTPYESGLQTDFQYPTPTTEDLPPLTNGYQSSLGYDSQVKYPAYSQYPNGSANGYSNRNYSTLEYYHHLETAAMRPHEGMLKSSPPQPTSPPNLLQPPPCSTIIAQKKTGSPEIKLRITKTIQNGREMFESSLCGDLLHEFQAREINRKKHERRRERKEKRKKSSRHHHHHHHHHHREELKVEEPQPHEVQKMEPPEEEAVQHLPISPLQSEVRIGVWFQVGDLVWSKVGTYPWWPCMVSSDPQLRVHSKINSRGAREYHVQFFSNEPERAWVHEKRMREYRGQKQYEQLLAEDSAKVVNQSERLKMRKPRPQKERIQWDIGIAHAEKALRMTREERIEQYTFIYVDPVTSPEPKKTVISSKRSRRSTSSNEAEPARPKEVSSPTSRHSAPVQSPSSKDNKDSLPETRRQSQRKQVQEEEPPPPPPTPPPVKIPWKTAAARKSLPASVLLHKGTIDLQKCNMSPVVKIENVLALHNASSDGFEQFIYTTKGVGNKTEITVKAPEKTSVPSPNLKAEKSSAQHTPAPETSSGATGRKLHVSAPNTHLPTAKVKGGGGKRLLSPPPRSIN